ncbi:uncharacterized protein N7484_010994 [Penicillium longicatenatum]|uniref:uncharacterized protein n=1 Tax=Penicillium longicatenatum TaxID=1561947 RepID=UPI002546A10D|nr:uncharacterized protein N7484_010994 [Penicillium longicatenatum]KAJ5630894.1 hypothetical protein N7484_010994 [Penicillium longicatenatum]
MSKLLLDEDFDSIALLPHDEQPLKKKGDANGLSNDAPIVVDEADSKDPMISLYAGRYQKLAQDEIEALAESRIVTRPD